MTDFSVEVYQKQSKGVMNITACLKCLGTACESIINKLEEEFEGEPDIDEFLCLLRVKLEIYKISRVYEIDENRKFMYKMYLKDFYNNVTSSEGRLTELSKKLKGGAFAMFCVVLKNALTSGIINMDDIIILEASGELEDKEFHGLIVYYEKIGFKQIEPENYEMNIENMSVPMYGRVRDVVKECMEKEISEEMKKILEQI
jgi:hypothetical protein